MNIVRIGSDYAHDFMQACDSLVQGETISTVDALMAEWRSKMPEPVYQVGDLVRCSSGKHICLDYIGLPGRITAVCERFTAKRDDEYGSGYRPNGLAYSYVVTFDYGDIPRGERQKFLAIEDCHMGDFTKDEAVVHSP